MWSGWKRSMLKGRVVLKEWDEMEKSLIILNALDPGFGIYLGMGIQQYEREIPTQNITSQSLRSNVN
jgi:hypothetical protein